MWSSFREDDNTTTPGLAHRSAGGVTCSQQRVFVPITFSLRIEVVGI